MELINNFKRTLLEQNGSASKITIKNYIADVKKFAVWFEATYKRPFPPSALPYEIVESYISPLQRTSPRSAKRYLSSLRKFFTYLTTQGVITYNPLAATKEKSQVTDLWHIREFDNFLYNQKAGPVTIKNYLADVRQFVKWITTVAPQGKGLSSNTNSIANIEPFFIEEYKNRLLTDAGLSPLSVNRKLSSLRKYINWADAAGFIKDSAGLAENILNVKAEKENPTQEAAENEAAPMTLESLNEALAPTDSSNQNVAASDSTNSGYSRFAPIRLLQKSKKGIGFLLDTLIILSVIKSIEAVKFNFWKATGREVFASVPTVLAKITESSLEQTSSAAARGISAPAASINTQAPVIDRFVRMGAKATVGKFRSIPKSVYAPMKISSRSLPLSKKMIFHLRYTRPNWYKRYHSYSFVHYIHFGIVLIVAVILGARIYQPFSTPYGQTAVLASNVGPNRQISFQGNLQDATGTPITRESPLRFAIYKSETASGSALLWQETQTVNPDGAGNFSTSLGKANPIKQEIFTNNPNLFLGISIGNSPELTPRQELASFALSKNAEALQGLKPITGNNAGTENVILALDSSGNLTIGGTANPIFQATGGEFTFSGQQLSLITNPGSNTNIVLNPDGTGIIDLQKPLQNTSENNNLSTALGAVEIDDNLAILASSSAQSALIINQNGTGELISASTGGSAKFMVSNSGSVTIGEDLNILGNNLTTATGTFSLANTNTLNLNIGGAATSISIGAKTGVTTINHNMDVEGMLKAKGGITLPQFTKGTIPFVGNDGQIASDSASLSWDSTNKRLGVGTTAPNKALDVQGGVEINLPGAGTSHALCHSSQTGTIDQEIVDCVGTAAADYMEFYSAETDLEIGDIAVPSSSYIITTDNDRLVKLKKSSVAYQSSVIGIISDKSKAGDFNSIGHNIRQEDNPQPIALNGRVPVKISKNSLEIKPGDYVVASNDPGKAMKATQPGVVIGKALEGWIPGSGQDKVMIYVNLAWFDPRAVLMDDGRMILAFETQKNDEESANSNKELAESIQNFAVTLKAGVLELRHISVQSLTVATDDIKIGTQTLRDYIAGIVNEIIDQRMARLAEDWAKRAEDKAKTIVVVSPIAEVTAEASPSAKPELAVATSPTPTLVASQSATYITNIYNNISTESTSIQQAQDKQLTVNNDPEASVSAQASNSAELSPSPTASPSATPTPNEELNIKNQELSQNTATSSAQEILNTNSLPLNTKAVNVATFSAELYYVPNLKADFATFQQGLITLGPTSLAETSISTQLSIGTNLKINENSINTIGSDLNIQPLRQGNLAIMGGLVTIDTEGNLTVEGNAAFAKDVTVKGTLAAGIISPLAPSESVKISGDIQSSGSAKFKELNTESFKIIRNAQADTSFTETVASASAGTAVITTNEVERTIITPYVSEESLIYITPVSPTQGVTPYIARQVAHDQKSGIKGSFTIQIPNTVSSDIKLNWWIVN
jgi:site-specific recombinase XerD